jgi:hypothetical protein
MEIDVLWIAKDASIASLMIERTVAVPVTSSRLLFEEISFEVLTLM